MTYGEVIEALISVWRESDAKDEPRSDDGRWEPSIPSDIDLMEKLVLLSVSYTEQKGKEDETK